MALEADPVLWSVAMSPHVPISMGELLKMPVRIILQAEMYAAAGARADRDKILDAAHKAGARKARGK